MAIWQYRAWVVPRSRLADSPETTLEIVREGEVGLWNHVEIEDLIAALRGVGLSPFESWNKSARSWGNPAGNYVELLECSGSASEIKVDIDAREISKGFILALVRLLADLDAYLLDVEGSVCFGDEGSIMREVRSSKAGQFVKDPRDFLKKLTPPKDSS